MRRETYHKVELAPVAAVDGILESRALQGVVLGHNIVESVDLERVEERVLERGVQ
jgi:hypothetical protein